MTTKSRKLSSALMAGTEEGRVRAETPATAEATREERGSGLAGGNWSRLAWTDMEARLHETREALDRAHEAHLEGLLSGRVPLSIPVSQITDAVGTDREEDPTSGAEFDALVDNIRRRGLRTPIRVRPEDPDWRPDPETPEEVGAARFVLQSGRRRLEACRRLERPVLAFLSFPEAGAVEDPTLDDLQERYFENTLRQDLTTFERLSSVGLIAERMPDMTQEQVAEILGVNPANVSRGRAVLAYGDRLRADLDLSRATRREIDVALKRYRAEDGTGKIAVTEHKGRGAPFWRRTVGDCILEARTIRGRGRVTLDMPTLDQALLDEIAALISERKAPPDT